MGHRVWYVAPWLVTALVMIPCSVIIGSFVTLEPTVFVETWRHLWQTQLPQLIINTLVLVIGVAFGAFLLGTTLAWTIVMYDFPGKRWLDGGLLLPMAIPGYVIGIVALDHWDYSGAVPSALRAIFGPEAWFPDIRSTWAVIIAMSLVLYPYVYIAARTAFREQSQTYLDLARNMGLNGVQVYWQVGVRLGRPTIMAGMALVIMETLADLGTVSIFAFDTMTTAIYETWFGLFQRQTAIQLSGAVMFVVFLLFYLERISRGRTRHDQVGGRAKPLVVTRLTGRRALLTALYPLGVVAVAFIYPLTTLIVRNVETFHEQTAAQYWDMVQLSFNSASVALLSAVIVVVIAVFVCYAKRILIRNKLVNALTLLGVSGFVLPGTIIALGVMIPLVWIDNHINLISERFFDTTLGLIITGSILGLLIAHTIRFFAVGFYFSDSGLSKITPSMDNAGMALGAHYGRIFRRIHLPLVKNSLMVGGLIVFIDVCKEMAATLVIRPFGFDTLATKIWELSAESYWEDAALPSVFIVLVMLPSVAALIYVSARSRHARA